MESTTGASSTMPVNAEIGGYRVLDVLSAGQSWLASAPGGRRVVLKVLDDDCLWKGQLHPSVKDRLGRVRELAHTGVANLHGVERDAAVGLTYLVWEHVPGEPIDRWLEGGGRLPSDLLSVARDAVHELEMLHARGIVHGSIKASNVIVGEGARAVLTHVSPLLYTDPQQDVESMLVLLEELATQARQEHGALAELVKLARQQGWGLRQIAARMGLALEPRASEAVERPVEDDGVARRIRHRAVAAAVSMMLLAGAAFAGLRAYASRHVPRPPVAPVAAPGAMERAPGPGAAVGADRRSSDGTGGTDMRKNAP